MDLASVVFLCAAAFVINMPFGLYRMGVKKYSWRWFLAIHLPIPLIILMRLGMGQSWRVVPFLFVFAIMGQLAGGALKTRNEC